MTFEEFAAAQLPSVLRFATVLTGSRAAGEDIVQEVLIKVHRSWAVVSSLDRPEFYVRKMVVNEFVSSRRRSWRFVPAGSGEDVDHRQVPDHAGLHAERQVILARLGKLPARQRAVLVLRFYEGYDVSDIAALLGIAPGTVRAHASRALAALRIDLSAQGSEWAGLGNGDEPGSPALPALTEGGHHVRQS
jgi:RNA polymerase sigma-70 factor (sigma-E family)